MSRFVPEHFDPSDFGAIGPLLEQLERRPLDKPATARLWLADLSELCSAIDEYGSRRHIDHTCHTEDPAIEKAYMHFIQQIDPQLKPALFRLQKKLLDSPAAAELKQDAELILRRDWLAEVEIFRQDNVPIQTRLTELSTQYNKLCGAMMIEYRGQELTFQQMAKFQEDPDRATRQEAWRLVVDRRLSDRDRIDSIFDEQIELRHKMALNAGLEDYRRYIWKSRKRFDYTPQHCFDFADAVAEFCVPLVEKFEKRRKAELGVETLRPWDLAVDERNRPALKPFEASDIGGFVDKTREVFSRIDPALGEQFESLRTDGNLDLDSRKGKAPGGYQCSLQQSRKPFIFMNAAGLQRDVEILLHEGGHAFHFIAAAEIPLMFLRDAPIEFCEVASMSMELLGYDHYDVFYSEAEAGRARLAVLEGVVRSLCWIANIDAFQHWIYTHPGHTRDERTQAWLELHKRFSSGVTDWSGLDEARQAMWHRQLHLFNHPFYYIEYGIAQLGALGVRRNYKQDPDQALDLLRGAFALGGTRPLPELFIAAGVPFDFSRKAVEPLIQMVEKELDEAIKSA